MKTPKDKYLNDSQYHILVDTLENFIHQCKFTPSELREAAVLACINYELTRTNFIVPLNTEMEDAFHSFRRWYEKDDT